MDAITSGNRSYSSTSFPGKPSSIRMRNQEEANDLPSKDIRGRIVSHPVDYHASEYFYSRSRNYFDQYSQSPKDYPENSSSREGSWYYSFGQASWNQNGYQPSDATGSLEQGNQKTFPPLDFTCLWYRNIDYFNYIVSSLCTNDLAKLATYFPKDNEKIKTVYLEHFYREVLKRLENSTFLEGIQWLADVLRPLESGKLFSDELTAAVCTRLEMLAQDPDRLKFKDVTQMARMMSLMISASSYHPFMCRIINFYCTKIQYIEIKHLISVLSVIRAGVMLHNYLKENQIPLDDVQSNLEEMISKLRCFLGNNPSLELNEKAASMVHWINLYGHAVMRLAIPCPELPKGINEQTTISHFQRKVEKALKKKLPRVGFEREKRLTKIGLNVDIYCDPWTVIEVDGQPYHCSQQLNLSDNNNHSVTKVEEEFRENARTALKRSILISSGYRVYNIQKYDNNTIDKLCIDLSSNNVRGRIKQPFQETWSNCKVHIHRVHRVSPY